MRLFMIDGSSYIYRAFYSIPPLSNSAGLPTNAIFGFTNILLKLLKRHEPEYIVVCLDAGRRTFRNDIMPTYKANRPAAPSDLAPQFPYFRKVIEALGIKLLEMPGYEADDIIATLCERFRDEAFVRVVVSSDKDLMQLVDDDVHIFDSAKDVWICREQVREKFGVEPEQVVEVMGLVGDAVDNIPGVKGVGDKTATALIKNFGNLENLYNKLDDIGILRRTRMLLQAGKESAFLSRQLATLKRDVPIECNFEDLKFDGFDVDKARALFAELEFNNLAEMLCAHP